MASARPGKAVRGSTSGRPIMALLDLLGRRWMLRILYELGRGAGTFGDLEEACDSISPSVLSQRLRDLKDAKLIESDGAGKYRMTRHGREIGTQFAALDATAKSWARALERQR